MIAFFEDIEIGEESALGAHAFTREAIIEFARAYDPQRFHLDEAAGEGLDLRRPLRLRLAHRPRAMRVIVDARRAGAAEPRRAAKRCPPLGVSPGVATCAGRADAARRHRDLLGRASSKRETKRPQWGLVAMRTWGVNQDGREVCAYTLFGLAARRSG